MRYLLHFLQCCRECGIESIAVLAKIVEFSMNELTNAIINACQSTANLSTEDSFRIGMKYLLLANASESEHMKGRLGAIGAEWRPRDSIGVRAKNLGSKFCSSLFT